MSNDTKAMSEICSKLAIKTPEPYQLRHSSVFFIFDQISDIDLVFPLLTLNEQTTAGQYGQ